VKNFIKLVTQVKNDLIKAKGDFILFVLIKLDSSKRWDIVVCADWLSSLTERDAVSFIVNELKKKLTREDFVYFSRVVVLKKDEPFMAEIQHIINFANIDVFKNGVILKNKTILHLNVKEMRVLYSKPNQIVQPIRPAIYNEIAKLDNLKVLQDIKNLVDSKIHAKETANIHQLSC